MARNRSAPLAYRGPALNTYAKSRLPKDEDNSFDSLLSVLGSGATKDEKHLKQLLLTTIPRIAVYSGHSESVIAPLVNLVKGLAESKKDHKKLIRQIYCLLQMLLGLGQAGSPGATTSDQQMNAATIDRGAMKDAWAVFVRPSGDLAQQRVALRVMAAIVRANRQSSVAEKRPFADHLAQTLATILNKDFQVETKQKSRILFKSNSQKSGDTSKELHFLQAGALSAVRVALSPGGKRRLAPRGFPMLDSNNVVAARHALALAAELAEKDSKQFEKAISPHLAASIAHYAADGYLHPASESSSGTSATVNGEVGPLTLTDNFARVYLSRGCGSVVHDLGISKAKNSPFWKALVLLACNDPSELVANEAIKTLVGAPPAKTIDLSVSGRQRKEFKVDEDAERIEKIVRWNAWQTIVKDKPPPPPGEELDPKHTILSRIVHRLRRAISSGAQPALCGASRSAAEVARARGYATSTNQKNSHKVKSAAEIMNPLRDDLMVLATSSWHYNAAQQSIALHALIWLQGIDGGPLTPPVLTQILSTGDGWSQEMLSELLQTLFQRLVVEPEMATYILDCVNALVAGNPSKVRPVEIVDFWSQSFEQANKTMVLRAALQFLEAPLPPRVSGVTGANPVAVAHSTEEATAWRKLRRIATWWLGEAANFITDEYVWEEFTPILANGYGLSTSDVIAMECMRNPLLITTISYLQQALMTGPWGVRLATAKSLTTIALRSGEPFRIQIYRIFKNTLAGDKNLPGSDPFGLALVLKPIVDLLDAMYSGQEVVEGCLAKWGGSLDEWPEGAALSLELRHNMLLAEVQKHCTVPDGETYFPLGIKSQKLLLGEEIAMTSRQDTLDFGRPDLDRIDDDMHASGNHAYMDHVSESEVSSSDDGFIYPRRPPPDAGVSLRHFAEGNDEGQEPDSRPSTNDDFGGFNAGESMFHSVPEGEAQVYEEEAGGSYADWGQYDQDPVTTEEVSGEQSGGGFFSQNSAISSVTSPEDIPSQPVEAEQNGYAGELDLRQQSTDMYQGNSPGSTQVLQPYEASVMYDFTAELDGELSVVVGDVIEILEEREGGWYFARLGDQEGLVPCLYVAEQPGL